MVRAVSKHEAQLATTPYSNEIINDDGSLLKDVKLARRPINGLNTLDGDLDAKRVTVQTQLEEKSELNAKFAELEELIRKVRAEMEEKC